MTGEHKKNISLSLKGKKKPWLEGKSRPNHSKFMKNWYITHPEALEIIKQRMLKLLSNEDYLKSRSNAVSGNKNPNWKGGISKRKYKEFYKKLKNEIGKRDNYTCQLCGKNEKLLKYTLSVHHIDFNKENSNKNNLICLCKKCNSFVNFDRNYWMKFFRGKIDEKL